MSGLSEFLVQASATLAGAGAAFGLEAWRQRRREKADKQASIKRALFVLVSQRSFLRNLEAQHLHELRGQSHRAFLLRPVYAVPSSLSIDLSALTFLLELPDKNVLPRIELADLRFRTVLGLLDERNRVYLEFQRRVEVSQVGETTNRIAIDDLRRIIGPVLSAQLEQLTDHLLDTSEAALESNRAAAELTDSAFRSAFPKDKLFRTQDIPLNPGIGKADV